MKKADRKESKKLRKTYQLNSIKTIEKLRPYECGIKINGED